jgi:hypothetical protein
MALCLGSPELREGRGIGPRAYGGPVRSGPVPTPCAFIVEPPKSFNIYHNFAPLLRNEG